MIMTKLLESGWKYELFSPTHLLKPDKGNFELPAPTNENFSPEVQESLKWFREKLLSTTALNRVDSSLREYNAEVMGILNLNAMTAEERTTYLLAKFFKDTKHAVSLILADRSLGLKPVNDNYTPVALAA
jgi:hypothetical protein